MKLATAFLALSSFLLFGCAGATPRAETGDRVLASGPGESALLDRQLAMKSNIVYPSPPLIVMPAVRAVYGDLGIELKLWDPTTGEVGNRNFSKMYRLGLVPLSRYVGCGSNAAGSAADNYRIAMNLVSRVLAEGTGSRIETRLTATADDVGSSKGRISCESLGALETLIHERVAKKLAAAN